MTVVDASAMVGILTSDPEYPSLADALGGASLEAPIQLDLEVVSALRGMARVGRLTDDQCGAAIATLRSAPIHRHPHLPLLDRIWELRHNVTPYDAAYVALAERLGATLVTGDRRLAQAPGVRCRVEVVGG